MLIRRLEDVEEKGMMALLEKDFKRLRDGDDEHERTTKDNSTPDLELAVAKLKEASMRLSHILAVLADQWHPDPKLPEVLTMDDLEKSITDTNAAIQKLIAKADHEKEIESAKTGLVHNLAKGAESVCIHVKPFLRTFLAVAVQGSAVRLGLCLLD